MTTPTNPANNGTGRRLVILVTGCRRGGIGWAVCKRLAEDGHRVIVAERDKAGRVAAREIRASSGDIRFYRLDVANEKQVAKLMERIKTRYGALHAIVCNAGAAGSGPDNIDDLDVAKTLWLYKANYLSAQVVVHAALRSFFRSQPEGGNIVLMGSTNGRPGNPAQLGYAAAKCALSALMNHVVAKDGRTVRCNLVRPGTVFTNSLNWLSRLDKNPDYAELEAQKIPLGRLTLPDEVAAVVALLVSPQNTFLQGCEIAVDGGWSCTGNLLPGGASLDRDAFVEMVTILQKATGKRAA
jgi:NAD(P)-dependent dehydrogenase (short-subunit alcohol dehydrogenase family)